MQGLSWAGMQQGGLPTAVQKGCVAEQEGGGARVERRLLIRAQRALGFGLKGQPGFLGWAR
jgi:hypothetical protein